MKSRADAILTAQSDFTCEFLLNFMRHQKELKFSQIKNHVEIDETLLKSKIDILKSAKLINNHTEVDEDKGVVDRIFSLTETGKDLLDELGYDK